MTDMPSPDQIRAARGMLDWSIVDLAKAAHVSISTVQRLEGTRQIITSDRSLALVQDALETEGVRFLAKDEDGYGIRVKKRLPRAVDPAPGGSTVL